jgi:hypothetical protein
VLEEGQINNEKIQKQPNGSIAEEDEDSEEEVEMPITRMLMP